MVILGLGKCLRTTGRSHILSWVITNNVVLKTLIFPRKITEIRNWPNEEFWMQSLISTGLLLLIQSSFGVQIALLDFYKHRKFRARLSCRAPLAVREMKTYT